MEIIGKNITAAVYANDYEAKAQMQLGAMFGGLALSQADIAGVHCMGEALGGLFDTPHGIANASVLPYVMAFEVVGTPEKYARIAEVLGGDRRSKRIMDAAYEAAGIIKRLNDTLQIPTLEEIGVKPEDFQGLAEKSAANASNPSNVRNISVEEYYMLFEKAYKGEL